MAVMAEAAVGEVYGPEHRDVMLRLRGLRP